MLLLLTIALVLIGAVALVIGFVQEAMFPIYLSIACSLGAAVVLVLFTRLSRARLATAPGAAGTADVVDEPRTGADFPISDYDDRRVAEIVPLLGDLDRRDLELVRRHEADGRNRTTILRRIDDLMDEQADAGDDEIDDAGEDTLVGAAAAFGRDSDEDDADEQDEDLDDSDSDEIFPIAEYDDLSAAEILPLLDELTDDELEEVADREVDGDNRAVILDRIDVLLGDEGEAPAKKKATAKKSSAKKATTKKSAAKKSSAKKAPAKKKAAAKKSSAKKSSTKKSSTKKAAAKKK